MSIDQISLKRAGIEEVDAFADIKAETYADDRMKVRPQEGFEPEWYYGEWYRGLAVVDKEEARRLLKKFDCYFILLDEKKIGILWIHQGKEGALELEDFCILPEYQGKGYGKQVLRQIEEHYPKNEVWTLSTPFFCIRNQHLYENAGYEKVGMCSKDTVVIYEKQIMKGAVEEA